ncbi:hypothetical protein Aperf_G00000118598 [Anoplocephala perfoliata]
MYEDSQKQTEFEQRNITAATDTETKHGDVEGGDCIFQSESKQEINYSLWKVSIPFLDDDCDVNYCDATTCGEKTAVLISANECDANEDANENDAPHLISAEVTQRESPKNHLSQKPMANANDCEFPQNEQFDESGNDEGEFNLNFGGRVKYGEDKSEICYNSTAISPSSQQQQQRQQLRQHTLCNNGEVMADESNKSNDELCESEMAQSVSETDDGEYNPNFVSGVRYGDEYAELCYNPTPITSLKQQQQSQQPWNYGKPRVYLNQPTHSTCMNDDTLCLREKEMLAFAARIEASYHCYPPTTSSQRNSWPQWSQTPDISTTAPKPKRRKYTLLR